MITIVSSSKSAISSRGELLIRLIISGIEYRHPYLEHQRLPITDNQGIVKIGLARWSRYPDPHVLVSSTRGQCLERFISETARSFIDMDEGPL